MRRRQIYAAAASAVLDRGGSRDELREALINDLADAMRADALHALLPGTCPNCLKHVGKGIAIHRRNCKG
jgi:hypothetical protein